MPDKKVLLLVVDALTPRVMTAAMSEGRLPHLRQLCDAGFLDARCSSVFPSITPAATASIVTGAYPCEHGILGAYWYDPDTADVLYFGDDLAVILKQGPGRFFENFVVRLNQEALTAPTLYERVENAGRSSACVNYLVFRGGTSHEITVPLPLSLVPGVPFSRTVNGPQALYLGDFVSTPLRGSGRMPRFRGGPLRRYGLRDQATTQILLQLVQAGLPDLTVAYFPDYDFRAHRVGPDAALPALQAFDDGLGRILKACGGLPRLLDEHCVIVTSDHAQSDVPRGKKAEIRLNERMAEFQVADAGLPWGDGDEIKACPNMRTAQIYFRHLEPAAVARTTHALLADARVDQVIRSESRGRVAGYHVDTVDRGALDFWLGAGGSHTVRDEWGQPWSWSGSLDALGVAVDAHGVARSEDYPNAFERIAGGLCARDAGHLWVTARPGAEFRLPETKAHRAGGSHGSLHALDSHVPLVVAGLPHDIELRAPTRTIDVAPLCLRVLGLTPPRAVGAPYTAPIEDAERAYG